ncbi:hypothetical protein [Staphylococcus gallinarum]|uniref:Phage protein n=1 Tax=Staphylococcus gallinarum TaxID=1293 RepID=A0A380FFU6_STAGA|nr:hypothetical protein [Staphylococcus gallinarum]GEQ04517.1 hypothetical protein SGA02_03450 [Staphylococcus gallinarum]SUM32064.1 Uncharacterised protein [Staphylococcus gallinarum]
MEIIEFSHDNETYTYIVETVSGIRFSHTVHIDMPFKEVTNELLQREKEIENQHEKK